jgi:hypothetical protein
VTIRLGFMTKGGNAVTDATTRQAELIPLPAGDAGLGGARPEPDLTAVGWSATEYVAAGQARGHDPVELPADGRWTTRPSADPTPFRTRVLVRRPQTAPASGVLVVEWLNVSAGADSAPDWTYLAEELLRRGHAWAGVSAQSVGVEGGAGAVVMENATPTGLKQRDPARYGDLSHPGDRFSFDIFGQVARAVADLTGARHVLAIGESQSASALTTYVNGVHPGEGLFDGFLVHSRPGTSTSLTGDRPLLEQLAAAAPVRIRDDLSVPVLVVQTEGDMFAPLAYLPARQPDAERLRVWEIAGSAHSDAFMIGAFEEFLGCPKAVNHGQQAFVVRAALRALETWVTAGTAPPSAPPLDTTADGFAHDRWGNVTGGVRTPVLDAAVERLSGLPVPGASPICALFGSSEPLPGDAWPDRDAYLAAYAAATDRAVAAGFVLAEDRDAVLAEARPELVGRAAAGQPGDGPSFSDQ